MKNKRFLKPIVILFLTFSLMTIGIISFVRMNVESKNNSVEIIIEYQELKKLAAQSEYSMTEWLIELKSVGLNSVAIMEETLLKYISNGGGTYTIANKIFNNGNWESLYPEKVVTRLKEGDKNNLLIQSDSKIEYDTIVNGLNYYKNIHFWNEQIGSSYYIIVDQHENDLLYADSNDLYNSAGRLIGKNKAVFGTEVLNVPIGFDREKIRLIEESGLKLVLRPVNYDKDPMSSWELYVSETEKYGTGSGLILFDGEAVVGYGAENNIYISAIQKFVAKNNMKIALTETMEQREYSKTKGLPPIVESLSKDRFVRLFNIWDFIAKRYEYNNFYTGGEEIGNSIFRGVTERNIRAVYFRPFIKFNGGYVTKMEDYTNMFQTLEGRLQEHGYHYGDASTFDNLHLPLYVKMLVTFQISLFGLFLLNTIIRNLKLKYNLILVGVAAIGSFGAYYIMPNMVVLLSALAAAVIFSTGSVVYFINHYLIDSNNKGILHAIRGLVNSSFISLVGALYIGSIMVDSEFLLEIRNFKGVKASLLLPIVAIIFIVVIYYIMEISKADNNNFINESLKTTKLFLNTNIKIKYALLLGVVGVVGYVYLARTGNESSLEPLKIELWLRNFLEEVLLARPRTKEFMLAFPSMIVGSYYAKNLLLKKDILFKYIYILFFAVLAVIGQSSITNTFSHIRTPLYLSLARVGYSVLFSVVIGTVAIIFINLFIKLLKKIIKGYKLKKV